jgi:phosphatidylserine/phosphatidylglycerophosphate/cardiolipin synthase-like enzyme
MLAVIDGAQHTLNIENEEMASQDIVDHLVRAAQRGVDVDVTMTYNYKYDTYFDQLTAAGVHVDTYSGSGSSTSPYIHAKDIVADGTNAYMGSINFSENSMTNNRELGIVTDDPGVVAGIDATDQADFAGGTPYSR